MKSSLYVSAKTTRHRRSLHLFNDVMQNKSDS